VEYLSLLLVLCYQFASLAHQGEYALFVLPFLADILVESLLVILSMLCQVQLQPCLGPPDPIPTQAGSIPILFSGFLSLLPLPVHLLLALWFDQQVSTQPCPSLTFLG